MMPIIVQDLFGQAWQYDCHYNMGRDGYGYGHRCIRYPRLSFIDRTFKPSRKHPDGLFTRTWYVDGKEVASIDTAVEALNAPPTLSADEVRILELVPVEFQPLRQIEDDLAGVERPRGAIMPDTPHSRVLIWLHALRDKGLIEYGKTPERSDGEPWPDSTPQHLRWSPTVRRTPGAKWEPEP